MCGIRKCNQQSTTDKEKHLDRSWIIKGTVKAQLPPAPPPSLPPSPSPPSSLRELFFKCLHCHIFMKLGKKPKMLSGTC